MENLLVIIQIVRLQLLQLRMHSLVILPHCCAYFNFLELAKKYIFKKKNQQPKSQSYYVNIECIKVKSQTLYHLAKEVVKPLQRPTFLKALIVRCLPQEWFPSFNRNY